MATTPKHAGEAPAADLAPSRATPMLRQYFEMKGRAPDAILFYRMGDFYEMFFEDAKEAAPLLGIALTARNRDSDIEAPMCGVPWHSADHHIAKLISAGRKVAVCDQVEDPRSAKGLVRRDITRVTPAVLDPSRCSGGRVLAGRRGPGHGWRDGEGGARCRLAGLFDRAISGRDCPRPPPGRPDRALSAARDPGGRRLRDRLAAGRLGEPAARSLVSAREPG